jgi:ABC-type branched-subunit amino acid transport system substrate-binding protein
VFGFGAANVRAALTAVRAGREVNFDGAASKLDFDAAGDLTSGEIGVWQFQSGALVEIDRFAYADGSITPPSSKQPPR